MNFVGKFDARNGPDAHSVAHGHVDAAPAHVPADAIIIPDAQLLFGGDFKRSGVDLILSRDDHELVVHDYFKGENRAALSSPDGAYLTGDIVKALTGYVEYAQADGAAAAAVVVGHVTKLTGSATAIRNGVAIILNQGDNVDKGDVLQSGSDSSLGVTFIDGTVFGLSSNAKMVVNEMVYDPNGSNNSSLLSLVAGTISFVAGDTAKHGDMKVDTPVATMGIRGTAVLVEIDFDVPGGNGAPSANFQVLVEPDGTTGSYILFDKTTLAPLATVNAAGTLTKISQGVVSFQAGSPLTPDEQKLITDVFQQKFTDNNVNPKTNNHAFTDTPIPQSLAPIKTADGTTATPVVIVVPTPPPPSPDSKGQAPAILHIPGPPVVVAFADGFTEKALLSGSSALDTLSGQIRFADVNAGDLPTVAVKFASFAYRNAQHQDITATLTSQEQAAIHAVETLNLQQDPGNKNNGSATWTYSFADGAFDFLGAGETLTLTYTALVNNNYQQGPETGTKQFTITITGTNDVPVITSGVPQTIAFAGGTSVSGGDLTTKVPTSGTLSFDDPDLTDTHTVSVKLLLDGLKLPPAPLQIFENALTASIAADSTGTGFGKIDWKLADLPVYLADFIPKGETVKLTYAVTVTDSQGATATQDITVTITGTDTPAVVWIATTATGAAPGELWSDAANWETGTVPTASDDAIVITDQLIGLTPSYPVTIDAPAEAKSLTMNDFGTSPPEVINQSTLTIGGAFNMSADSVFHNAGTISVGGLMEVLDKSVVLNSGTLMLKDGGGFSGQATITNAATGLIEISGGTLDVGVDVANDGLITVDSGAALIVSGAIVTGGTVTNNGALTLDAAVLKDGTLDNNHVLDARTGAVLENESVSNTGTIEVLALGALLLDQATSVANIGGTITVDGTGTLTLNDATIDGGTIDNYSPPASPSGSIIAGDIDVTGSSTISNAHLNNGTVTIESGQTLTLDGTTVTGTTFADTASGAVIQIDGTTTLNGVTINGGTINDYMPASSPSGKIIAGDIDISGSSTISNAYLNNGTVTIESGRTLTLDGTTVTGTTLADTASGAIIQIDGNDTLTLNGATIDGGTIDNYSPPAAPSGSIIASDIDVTGSSAINNAYLNHGTVTIESGQTLTLRGDTVTGTAFTATASGAVILIDGADTLDGVTITGGTVANTGATLIVDAGQTLILQDGATVVGGTLDNSGTVEIEGSEGLILDGVNVTGSGAIQIDRDTSPTQPPLVLEGGTLFAGGVLTVGLVGLLEVKSAAGATLSDEAVTNNNTIEVFAASDLTLDNGTVVTNKGVIAVDGTGTLTLSGATIDGGTIDNGSLPSSASGSLIPGDIDVIGSSTISNAGLNNGDVTIESGTTLTLDDDTVTGTTFADTASGAIIQIDGVATLDGVTINGGTVNDYTPPSSPSGSIVSSDIDVTGSSTISNASLNNGHVTVESGTTLTLAGDTVTGTAFTAVATGSIIAIDGNDTLSGVTISGGGVTIGAGARVTTSGDVSLTNTSVTNDGTLEVTGGTLKIAGSVASSGPDAGGSIQIDAGAVLDLDGSDTQTIVFAGANAELKIDASSFGGSISGLAATDEIDLSGITYGLGTTATYCDGVLTITDGSHPPIHMTLVGDYSNAHFAGSSDGHGGTLITLNASDDAPAFDSADKAQTAGVTELADTTGSTASDSSSPTSGIIHFTDIDLTDRPAVAITSQSVTWTDSAGHLLSSPTLNEVNALEQALSLTASNNTNNGSVSWNYAVTDGALDFLGAGETATVTSTVLLHDHRGKADSTTVTVTIHGANDAPVLAADGSGVKGTDLHAVAELAGRTGDTADQDSASGTLSFTDPDLTDTHTFSQSGPTFVLSGGTLTEAQVDALDAATLTLTHIDSTGTGAGSIGFSYSAADSSFDFLGAGQTLAVTYSITVTDNSGVSSSQPVTFTITGSNDAPVADAHDAMLSYTASHAAAAIDAGLTLSDVDSATLGSATVQISGNFVAGEDVLGFTDQNGICGSYDAAHGILTLTGTSSVANYQAALASVTYFDGSNTPSTAPRTVSFTVDDGAAANSHSNTVTATVNVSPPPLVAHDDVISNAAPPAGSGWVLDTDNGHYYREVASFVTFGEAVADAAADGGYLATITSAAEQSFVTNHVIGGFSATWLGGETNNDVTGAGPNQAVFSWLTGPEAGSNFVYSDWNSGEPSGGFGAATQYVQIESTGAWNDATDKGQSGDGNGAGYLEEWGGAQDQIAFRENTGTTIAVAMLLANDTDTTSGSHLTVTGVSAASAHGGTVTLDGTVIDYTPGADYFGADSFTYTVSDGSETSTATVSFNVSEAGTAPVTIADGATVELGASDAQAVTFAAGGTSGTLMLDAPESFTGEIAGISGSGDVLDLHGFAAATTTATTGAGSYDTASNVTTLTVTDSSDKQIETFKLVGDYSASTWTVTDDHGGGANIVDPPAPKAVTIASGGSLEISSAAASAEDVTFHGSTGSLVLDHPASFTGTISGFTGDGTLSGSDQIDLKGIDYHATSFTESYDANNDTLSVSDGSHSALIHFTGSYQAANFSFTTDNNGGTIVYDPPVAGNPAPKAPAVTATSQGFVFNFAGSSHDAANGGHPAGDTHVFDGQTFVNAEADLARLHDDGHGHAVAAPDSFDSPSVAAIKAQLHVHDFHFV